MEWATMTSELKKALTEYGLRPAQINSATINKFLNFMAINEGLIKQELAQRQEALIKSCTDKEEEINRLEWRKTQIINNINGNRTELNKMVEERELLKAEIVKLKYDKGHAEAEEEYNTLGEKEGQFLKLIDALRKRGLTEQEWRSTGFIGNAYFGGKLEVEEEENCRKRTAERRL